MGLNKSPGDDGIPLEFYIAYWDIIKVELCDIFNTIIDSLRLDKRKKIQESFLLFTREEQRNILVHGGLYLYSV